MSKLRLILNILGIALIVYLVFPYKSVSPEFKPYYNEFMGYVQNKCTEKQYNNPYKIIIDTNSFITGDIVGVCLRSIYSYRIYIKTDFWKTANDIAKYGVIMHELTHCVLRMDHSEDPNNYMYPYYDVSIKSIEQVKQQLMVNINNTCNSKEVNHDIDASSRINTN